MGWVVWSEFRSFLPVPTPSVRVRAKRQVPPCVPIRPYLEAVGAVAEHDEALEERLGEARLGRLLADDHGAQLSVGLRSVNTNTIQCKYMCVWLSCGFRGGGCGARFRGWGPAHQKSKSQACTSACAYLAVVPDHDELLGAHHDGD